jgi:hypothetical protein
VTAKPLAVLRAVSFIAVVLDCGLPLFPMISHSEVKATDGIEVAGQATIDDFVEYAGEHKVDVHDVFFGFNLYEGTQTCMLCHEDEAIEMLD